MPVYRVLQFNQQFEIDDDEEVVAASLSNDGTRVTSHSSNLALVKAEEEEEYECGYGGCSRSNGVDGPNERCWQHEEPE